MPSDFGCHCDGCQYQYGDHLPHEDRAGPLEMEDNGSPILLVFQAPGEQEWVNRRPISSTKPRSAGNRLKNIFALLGKARESYNITNAVQCFPGKKPTVNGNKPRDRVPSASARRSCVQWLRNDLEAREYTKVIVFGAIARKAVESIVGKADGRFEYLRHPTGGISTARLCQALGGEWTPPREVASD